MNDVRKATYVAPDVSDDDALLIEFVRHRDVKCPRCGYNLRNLAGPVCPECEEGLKLQIGVEKIYIHWLLCAIAPGVFCGIAVIIFAVLTGILGLPGTLPVEGVLTLAFLVVSGIFTVGLASCYRRFLLMSYPAQFLWAFLIWGMHIAAFVAFVQTL